MELRITHFSQDISLDDPSNGKYYIVVETNEGQTVRLPVQQETTDALVKLAFSKRQESSPKVEEQSEEVVREEIARETVEAAEQEEPTPDDDDLDGPIWIPDTQEEVGSIDERGRFEPELDEDGVASV